MHWGKTKTHIDGRCQDVISLVVQGVGGGLAATAVPNGRDPRVVRIIFLAPSNLRTDLSSRVAMSCLEGLYSSFVREVIHAQFPMIY